MINASWRLKALNIFLITRYKNKTDTFIFYFHLIFSIFLCYILFLVVVLFIISFFFFSLQEMKKNVLFFVVYSFNNKKCDCSSSRLQVEYLFVWHVLYIREIIFFFCLFVFENSFWCILFLQYIVWKFNLILSAFCHVFCWKLYKYRNRGLNVYNNW